MRSLLTVLLSILLMQSIAQNNCNSSLSGRVTDEHDSAALAFTTLTLIETQQSAVANSNGYYIISNICEGKYTIRLSHVGCKDTLFHIDVQGNQTINFSLEIHVEQLQEIKISNNKKSNSASVSNLISKDALFELQGKTLGKIVEENMGVNSLNTGSSISKPVIHGLHSNRILVFNNGVRHESQQWGSEHGPEIDPFIADEITIVKGAACVRYGSDAIGGVLLVDPKKLKYDGKFDGELNTVAVSNGRMGIGSLMLQGGLPKIKGFAWRAQGTYKRGGNLNTPTYYLKNTGIEEYNFSLASGYKTKKTETEVYYSQFNTQLCIFSGSHIGNLSDLQKAFNSEKPLDSAGFTYDLGRPYQLIEHELFKTKFSWNISPHHSLKTIYARQYNLREEFDKHLGYGSSKGAPAMHLEITTHSINSVWEYSKKNHIISSGVNASYQKNTFEGKMFIPNFLIYHGGAYLLTQWWNKKWVLEAGARYDVRWQEAFFYKNEVLQNPGANFHGLSANAGVSNKVNNYLSIVLNASYAWRPPSINELYSNGLHHGAAAIEVGDENLKKERSWNGIASVKYDRRKFSFEAEAYYNYIYDFIFLSPTPTPILTIRGAFPAFEYKHCEAILSGINYQIKQNIGAFSLKSKGSYLNAWNKSANDYIVMMPANQINFAADYAFKENKTFSKTKIELGAKHVFKQNKVPANTDVLAPPNAYTVLNASFSTHLSLKKQTLIVSFDVDNLLNARYRDYMNRFRYFSDELGRTYTLRLRVPLIINQKSIKNEND